MTKILLVDKNSILDALKDELANIVNNGAFVKSHEIIDYVTYMMNNLEFNDYVLVLAQQMNLVPTELIIHRIKLILLNKYYNEALPDERSEARLFIECILDNLKAKFLCQS